ncbi:MAG: hypothetical protein MI810_01650 [Flavobacteriales bacterium]|nr:hypothetical protein [Flavobacteriales bacterium]
MDVFEKAKLALRKKIATKKSSVANDLEKLRSKSKGEDVYSYMINLSEELSVEKL